MTAAKFVYPALWESVTQSDVLNLAETYLLNRYSIEVLRRVYTNTTVRTTVVREGV